MTDRFPINPSRQPDPDRARWSTPQPAAAPFRPAHAPTNRPTNRVDHQRVPVPVPGRPPAITGPESMTPPAVLPSRSEGLPAPRGRHQLECIRRSLSERDWRVLDQLARFRYLTTTHLEQLCFADHVNPNAAGRACRRVLARLAFDRVIEHLERRIGGVRAGSQSFVWRVGVTGDRLLRQRADSPRDRRHEPGLRFLDHVLAVADCAVRLTLADRFGVLGLEQITTEPDSWRRYTGPHGGVETLKPDLYARTASGDFEDHWFIEIDRGTESLPVVIRQCQRYEVYRATGQAQADLGVFPLVLWLTPDEDRATRIRTAIERTPRLDRALYRSAAQTRLLDLVTGQGAS